MPDRLDATWRALCEACVAARATPLSSRRAMLAALLMDELVEQLATGGDVLAVRRRLAGQSVALAAILELCRLRPGGAHLVVEAVAVPLEDYPALAVEDFMVSLYNGHTVQRLLLVREDGRRLAMVDVLDAAMVELRALYYQLTKAPQQK